MREQIPVFITDPSNMDKIDALFTGYPQLEQETTVKLDA